MKKIALFCLAVCAALALQAQNLPYSKYLDFSKEEFKENHFKYHEKHNTWSLSKIDGLSVTVNLLAIIADAEEDIRPGKNDYQINVQLGQEEKASYVEVYFYNDETFHKLLTFIKDHSENVLETSSGKLTKYQAYYGDYAIELNIEQHIISRTSARTSDPKSVKNVDESYNEYEFIITTDVEPWSPYLDRQAAKKAKRAAKGKKPQSVEDMM